MSKKEKDSGGVNGLVFDDKKTVEGMIGKFSDNGTIEGDFSPMLKRLIGIPRLTDEEFIKILGEVNERAIPVSMLEQIFPFKNKRDSKGNFLRLSSGLDYRAKGLGIRITYKTWENPQYGSIFIVLKMNKMTEKELTDFKENRRENLLKNYRKGEGDIHSVVCDDCGERVKVGKVSGSIVLYCGCVETPDEAVNVTEFLSSEELKKWS